MEYPVNTITRKCSKALKLMLLLTLSAYGFSAQAGKDYASIDWQLPTARFADLDLNPKEVADLAQGGQFVVIANPEDFTFWNARQKKLQDFKAKRVVYAAMVIDAPAEEIQEMIWDIGSQDQFTDLLQDTKNIRTEDNVRIASFEQVIKAPIMKLASDFIVQLNKYDNGDIGMVLIDEGDVESMFQYYEFFPLGGGKTLTVLSSWQDTDSASLMYKVILEAEPVIGSVFPILATYTRLREFQEEAARRHPEQASKTTEKLYDIRSINGYITANKNVNVTSLKKLSALGSVQFYQQSRKLSHDGEINDVVQVSAIQYIPLPQHKIQPLLNDFSSLVEYNVLTDGWDDTDKTEEDWAYLALSIAIGPFKLPIDIYITQEEATDDKLIFYTAEHSYMHPLFGHIEYMKMKDDPEDNGTLVEVTIGGVLGPEASFLFKMARYLPYHNVLIAAVYTMVTAESATEWVTNRVAKDDLALAAEQVASAP